MTPTSGPGASDLRRRRYTSAGFTLVEIMVVLVIVGLFIGLISSVAQPDDRTLLRLETERLAQLLSLASKESRLTGKRMAWTADGPGYRFWRFAQDSGWSEIRDVDSLRPRTLPQGVTITGVRVENGPPLEHMRLEFAPSSAMLSFDVGLKFGTASDTVQGLPMGKVQAAPVGGEAAGETER